MHSSTDPGSRRVASRTLSRDEAWQRATKWFPRLAGDLDGAIGLRYRGVDGDGLVRGLEEIDRHAFAPRFWYSSTEGAGEHPTAEASCRGLVAGTVASITYEYGYRVGEISFPVFLEARPASRRAVVSLEIIPMSIVPYEAEAEAKFDAIFAHGSRLFELFEAVSFSVVGSSSLAPDGAPPACELDLVAPW